MSCPKAVLFSAYLDNQLNNADRTVFETHVKACAVCARELEALRFLQKAFTGAEHHAAPFGFTTRVLARTAELEKKKTPWFVPLFVRYVEAAVLLIVITMGIFAGKIMTNGPSAATTNIASSLSLDMFDATPPGSLGGAYLAMTEVRNEQ